ncbi:MAG: VWA domain-containing protein [Planctomycetes bacterium]|nr:VWA domain-containing protein [Planctomycetota bacterium]
MTQWTHEYALPTLFAQVNVERRFELTRLPENWTAVLGLALLAGLCWWVVRTYRVEARAGSTMARRMFLAGLRCVVVLLLALIWLEPVLATYLHQRFESYTLVLIDGSSSIQIADHYLDAEEKQVLEDFFEQVGGDEVPPGPYPRADLVELILKGNNGSFLKDLTRNNKVKLYTFADRTVRIATLKTNRTEHPDDDEEALAVEALDIQLNHSGSATDLGQTLRQAVDSLNGAPAAVVVISDGGFNQGESAEVLGDFAQARDIPIYTIGVGEAAPPRNCRVAELVAPPNAFINDPFEISTRIDTVGLTGEVITVELLTKQAGAAGEPMLVESKTIRTVPGVTRYPLSFAYRGERAGRSVFTVRATAGVAEPITSDNQSQTYVNILDNKMKVLLVASGPSWTYRFLARLLERDETFDVACWLQSADRTAVRDGNTVIDHLPDSAAELFDYDVIVLLDPDARSLPDGWAELVDTHVTRNGAGLMYCAARGHTPTFFHTPSAEPLVRLLPVVPHPEADFIINEIGYYQRQAQPIEFARGALDHAMFSGRLAGVETTRSGEMWKQLGRVFWHYPVRHEKAAATVLLRHGHPRMRNSAGGHVLLATQFVGAGRTTFLGFDGTWRWRRYGENLFDQFWVQNIRQLAEGRLSPDTARGQIQTDRTRYSAREPIVFRARLSNADYQPLDVPSVSLEIVIDRADIRAQSASDGSNIAPTQITLRSDPNRIGWYKGQFVPPQPAPVPARYIASIRLPGAPGEEDAILTHEIEVRESDREILKPQMDRKQLVTLARRSAGGAYSEINEAFALPERIPDRHETTTTRGNAEPLWDTGWMLAGLVGLLSLEWALRKRWHLL